VTPPPGADVLDRAVYLREPEALIVADLHVGRARASNVEFPIDERGELLDRVDALLSRTDPETVVVAGDLLHSFSSVPLSVAEAVEEFQARVAAAEADLVVTPGNHDTRLDAAFDGRTVAEHELGDGTVVCHGHEAPETDAERYVIGHDHPTIEIEGERHPCLLYGPGVHRGSDVLALPAFTPLAPGVAVNGARAGDLQSPLLARPGRFRPIVRDTAGEETLAFPPLSKLREHL
jgi:putative SbcD/Mre11-related phosphoesterase